MALGLAACASDEPPEDNGAVTGADDVDLPDPVDCEAEAVADRLRWTGGGAVEAGAGLSAVAVHGAHGFTCSDDGGFRAWSLAADAPTIVEMDDAACKRGRNRRDTGCDRARIGGSAPCRR